MNLHGERKPALMVIVTFLMIFRQLWFLNHFCLSMREALAVFPVRHCPQMNHVRLPRILHSLQKVTGLEANFFSTTKKPSYGKRGKVFFFLSIHFYSASVGKWGKIQVIHKAGMGRVGKEGGHYDGEVMRSPVWWKPSKQGTS